MMTTHETRVAGVGQAGFSLVEITLALLVVAVGLLSVFSLFPAGLDANAQAISDTHAAMFAEEVFNGLRGEANRRIDAMRRHKAERDPNPLAKTDDWFCLDDPDSGPVLPVSLSDIWRDSGKLATQETSDKAGEVYKNVYVNQPLHVAGAAAGAGGIADHALRYKLTIDRPEGEGLDHPVRTATLYVWPGEFGPTDSATNRTVFYTELCFYGIDL